MLISMPEVTLETSRTHSANLFVDLGRGEIAIQSQTAEGTLITVSLPKLTQKVNVPVSI
jgi:hypothetical protein